MSIDKKVRLGLIALAVAGAILSALLGANLSTFDVIGGGDLSPG